jgi:hypothetical protein
MSGMTKASQSVITVTNKASFREQHEQQTSAVGDSTRGEEMQCQRLICPVLMFSPRI